MKRKVIDQLIRWKKSGTGVPVMLTGAKGVGKTFLAYDYAKAFFENIYYINMEQDSRMRSIFMYESEESLELLKHALNITPEISREAGILILDEIGYCKQIIDYIIKPHFAAQFPYIICITSKPIESCLTEKLKRIAIFPLGFDEFLIATGNEWYLELIQTHYKTNNKLPDIVHKELLDIFNLYLTIGGMPGSINEYLSMTTAINVSEQHKVLWGAFRNHIMNDYQENDSFKMLQVLESITHQLMKENKKFQYKLIRKGTTHSMYKDAIQKLCDNHYIIRCNRLDTGNLSELYKENDDINKTSTSFKLYLPDTGIFYSKLAGEYEPYSNINFNKALLENYMAQMLSSKQYAFAFWESESMARIDFVIGKGEEIIPIEIFSDNNTRSKSLSVFKRTFDYPYAIKVSTKNYEFTDNIRYVPYYALFCI